MIWLLLMLLCPNGEGECTSPPAEIYQSKEECVQAMHDFEDIKDNKERHAMCFDMSKKQ